MKSVLVHKHIIQLCLGPEDLLGGAGNVATERLELVYVCHIDIELGVALRVNVQRESMGAQEARAIHCRTEGEEIRGRENILQKLLCL